MAITRVQAGAAGVTSTGTGTVTPTLPGAVTAGSLVVILAAYKTTANQTLLTPAGWQVADNSGPQGTSSATCAIFYKENCPAGQTLPAITPSAGTLDMYAYAIEYSGVATASSLDVHTALSNTGGTTTPATGTTVPSSQGDEVLVGITGTPNAVTTSSDAMGGSATGGTVAKLGEATSGNATAASRVSARSYEYIQTGRGTAEFHGTVSPARSWSGVVAVFSSVPMHQPPIAEHLPFVPRGRSM